MRKNDIQSSDKGNVASSSEGYFNLYRHSQEATSGSHDQESKNPEGAKDSKQAECEEKPELSSDARIAKQKERLSELSASQKRLEDDLSEKDEKLQKLREKFVELTDTLDETQSQLRPQGDSAKTVQSDLLSAKQNEEELKRQLKKLEDNISAKRKGLQEKIEESLRGITSKIATIDVNNVDLMIGLELDKKDLVSTKKEIKRKTNLMGKISELLKISDNQSKFDFIEEHGNKDDIDNLRSKALFIGNDENIAIEVAEKECEKEISDFKNVEKKYKENIRSLMDRCKGLGFDIPENVSEVEVQPFLLEKIVSDEFYSVLRKDVFADDGQPKLEKLKKSFGYYTKCRREETSRIKWYSSRLFLVDARNRIKSIVDEEQVIDDKFKADLKEK